jgi:glycosyltransferase involved in cell wall biosynthesis
MGLAGDQSKLGARAGADADRVMESGRQRLHIVVVDEELPYPLDSGKRLRSFHLLSRLAPRHRITYLAHRNADPAEARAATVAFRNVGIETILVNRSVPRKSGARFYLRLAANLLSPLPYSVATHRSRAMRQAVDDFAASHPVDLWHCEWTPYFEAVRHRAGERKLIMAHNVESQIWQRYYETERNLFKRAYIGLQWRKFEKYERAAFAAADQVVLVSPEDADRIVGAFGCRHVAVVDNGVDTDFFQPQTGRRDPKRVLFLGSLDWRPNLDAVDLLLDRIFPEVRAQAPSATLVIVGRNPSETMRQRAARTPRVELHANVPDVRPFLAEAGMLAVPLRIGGGSRLKILEALSAGVPVVSSRVGAEGLNLAPRRDITVVERAEDLAEAIIGGIQSPETLALQAESGRERVLANYDWNQLADRLERVWLASVEPSTANPARCAIDTASAPSALLGETSPAEARG